MEDYEMDTLHPSVCLGSTSNATESDNVILSTPLCRHCNKGMPICFIKEVTCKRQVKLKLYIWICVKLHLNL